MSKSLLVGALDLGTTYSGYAFSFRNEYEENPLRISTCNSWIGGAGLVSIKTPSSVLINPEKKLDSFGYEAEDNYGNLALEDKHDDWFLFRQFKMKLYDCSNLSRKTLLEDITGKTLPALKVFSFAIGYLKDHLFKTLKNRCTDIILDDIHWVLTVPAIWSDSAKQFMREAALKSGTKDERLSLALEPEAASIYCGVLPLEKKVSINKYDQRKEEIIPFEPGTCYLVLDVGGGTADITVHQVMENHVLKELHAASGGAWGGTEVDREFLQFLIKIFGFDVLSKLKNEDKSSYFDLCREIESKKRALKRDTKNKTSISIPSKLTEIHKDETQTKLGDAVKNSQFSNVLQVIANKIRIDADFTRTFFQPAITNIISHIKDILGKEPAKNVDTIIMVGGFSESDLLKSAVRDAFPDHRVIIPEDAGLAVLKGAVLFGHRPHCIKSRVSKVSYGIAITRPFQNGIDPLRKKKKMGATDLCVDVFKSLVCQGESVNDSKQQEPLVLRPAGRYDDEAKIRVFSSSATPAFIDDPSCQFLGEVIVKIAQTDDESTDRSIDVSLKFGGTEVTVEATDRTDNKVHKGSFDLLS